MGPWRVGFSSCLSGLQEEIRMRERESRTGQGRKEGALHEKLFDPLEEVC